MGSSLLTSPHHHTSSTLKMRAVLCLLLLALVAGVLSGKLFKKRRPVIIQRQPTLARTESVDHPEAKIRNKRETFLEGNCGYACNPDGSCRVTWEGPPRSGGVEASCFPAEFGRGCIGSVQGCRDCSQLCGDGRCNPFIGGC